MITLDDLKDFDVWKRWKNVNVEFETKPEFAEKRIQQMIHIGADDNYEQYSEGMSDDDIIKWKQGFVAGANWLLKNKQEKNI